MGLRRKFARAASSYSRRLRLEPLEERRVLAITVDTLADIVDENDGYTSLREGILTANASPEVDTIEFASALTANGPASIVLSLGELTITRALTIDGPGPDLLTINAAGNDLTPASTGSDGNAFNDGDGSRVFNIGDGVNSGADPFFDVTLSGLTLTGGDPADLGGAIYSREDLVVLECVITENYSVKGGAGAGGILSQYGSLAVIDSTVSNNSSRPGGGGIRFLRSGFTNSALALTRTMIVNNSSDRGGGLYIVGNATITASEISNNHSVLQGGGIHQRSDVSPGFTVSIHSSTISGNTGSIGGGIYGYLMSGTTLEIANCAITNNEATDQGGGIRIERATASSTRPVPLTIRNSEIRGNAAGKNGGAIFFDDDTISTNLTTASIESCTITDNSAVYDGAAIRADLYCGKFVVRDSTVEHNTPGKNLATLSIWAHGPASLSLTDSLVANNSGVGMNLVGLASTLNRVEILGNQGRGVVAREFHHANESLTVIDSIISGNLGGIEVSDCDVSITGSSITENKLGTAPVVGSRPAGGGGIYTKNCNLAVNSTTISGNTSHWVGGGIRSVNDTAVNISDSTIKDNSGFSGGGVHHEGNLVVSITDSRIAGNTATHEGGGLRCVGVNLTRCVIADNRQTGYSGGGGGGVFASYVNVVESVVSNNVAFDQGGGIMASGNSVVVLDRSSVTANRATGSNSRGGGIYGNGAQVSIVSSTVFGNHTTGSGAGEGGGVYGWKVTVYQSTISNNSTAGVNAHGGGIRATDSVAVTQSTVSHNDALHATAKAGGISSGSITINRSIVANNAAGTGNPNLAKSSGTFKIDYSLIGDATGLFPWEIIGTGNILNVDPLLGPLANNGGPTLPDGSRVLTHALLPGSPAINSGDPAAVAGVNGVPTFDQRGTPWSRVVGGRIDIGAVEQQANPLTGDYNFNGVVDAADYSVWMDTLGSTIDLRADGNGDGSVDADDYGVWTTHFGEVFGQGAGSLEQEDNSGGGALAASQRLAGESGEEVLSVLAVREDATREVSSRRAVRSRLFESDQVAEIRGDLLMTMLARRAKCADEMREIKLDREENETGAAVDEVFARVGARRERFS